MDKIDLTSKRLYNLMTWRWVYSVSNELHIVHTKNKKMKHTPDHYPVETEAGPGIAWNGMGLHLDGDGEIGCYEIKYPLSLKCPHLWLKEGFKGCIFRFSKIFCGRTKGFFCEESLARSRERLVISTLKMKDPLDILAGDFLLDKIAGDAPIIRQMKPDKEMFALRITRE